MNREDHLEIIFKTENTSFGKSLDAFVAILDEIEKDNEFVFDEDLGYVTCRPTNLDRIEIEASLLLPLHDELKTSPTSILKNEEMDEVLAYDERYEDKDEDDDYNDQNSEDKEKEKETAHVFKVIHKPLETEQMTLQNMNDCLSLII
mgnify:CR=1 FL=1